MEVVESDQHAGTVSIPQDNNTKKAGTTWKMLNTQESSMKECHMSSREKTSWFHFWSEWGLVMRSESLAATSNESGNGSRAVSWYKWSTSQDWRAVRFSFYIWQNFLGINMSWIKQALSTHTPESNKFLSIHRCSISPKESFIYVHHSGRNFQSKNNYNYYS